MFKSHCNATDKGPCALYYKSVRENEKKRTAITPSPYTRVSESLFDRDGNVGRALDRVFRTIDAQYGSKSDSARNGPNSTERGPWTPTQGAMLNSSGPLRGLLTQCRRCSYYNKFDHLNFTRAVGNNNKKAHHTGPLDLCHACGRVASEKDFGKTQSRPFSPSVGDILLGKKTIPFKIKANDPRTFRDVGKYWKRNEGKPEWVYDEVEMEEDFFRHQIGKRPELMSILKAVPVRNEIPEFKGDLRKGMQYRPEKSPSIHESNALLLEQKSDLNLLYELYLLHETKSVGVVTSAEWNKELRKGVSDHNLI